MIIQKPASKRRFTDAARVAASKARRLIRKTAVPRNTPEFFVVRQPPTGTVFGREIRRFGAVVLPKSDTVFSATPDSRTAKEGVLSRFKGPA